VAAEGDLEGLEDFAFLSCSKVERWEGTAWTRASPATDGEPDDGLQTCFPIPIFSARLRTAVEELGLAEFEHLPVKVIRSDGSEVPGWRIANALTCVDALDLALSEYSRFPDDYFIESLRGQIRDIRRTVLKGGLIRGRNVVRLSGYKPPLYVSEPFVRIFQKGRFTGYVALSE
jgi:hypothetical protein